MKRGKKVGKKPGGKNVPAAPRKAAPAAAAKKAAPPAPKKVEEKPPEPEEVKVEEAPVVEEAPKTPEPVVGSVIVLYSVYNQSFPTVDGVLKWEDVDEEYCFSFAFAGNWMPELYASKDPENPGESHQRNKFCDEQMLRDTEARTFTGLADGTYLIKIIEDAEEQEKFEESQNFQRYEVPEYNPKSKVDMITNELKNMTTEEILAKGDRYKELIEARDLEDILYS